MSRRSPIFLPIFVCGVLFYGLLANMMPQESSRAVCGGGFTQRIDRKDGTKSFPYSFAGRLFFNGNETVEIACRVTGKAGKFSLLGLIGSEAVQTIHPSASDSVLSRKQAEKSSVKRYLLFCTLLN